MNGRFGPFMSNMLTKVSSMAQRHQGWRPPILAAAAICTDDQIRDDTVLSGSLTVSTSVSRWSGAVTRSPMASLKRVGGNQRFKRSYLDQNRAFEELHANVRGPVRAADVPFPSKFHIACQAPQVSPEGRSLLS